MTVKSLRSAQKAFTRNRLLDAARELFYTHGYAAITIDQIAAQAGTRRSTLYTHFKDKEDILASLASQYVETFADVLESLPGPVPSRSQIDEWMIKVASFVQAQRTPTELFASFGVNNTVPEPVNQLGIFMFDAMAKNVLAFKAVRSTGKKQAYAIEWARAILRQLSAACIKQPIDKQSKDEFEAALAIAGDMMELFISKTQESKGTDQYKTTTANID